MLSTASTLWTTEQREGYLRDGYWIRRGAYGPERVQSLVEGVEQLMDRALANECKIRWIDRERRLPARIGNMLHPDKYQPAFAEWLDADIVETVEAILGGPARHSLFGMLASGGGQAYRTAWHRDLCKPGSPNEAAILARDPLQFCQFNAPLKPGDRFLQIIPGSHARTSTAEEMDAYTRDPNGDIPGQLTVELEPGDIAIYNANLWHRGLNPDGALRWSLHAAFWRARLPVMKHEYGQREALRTPGHLERMPPRTRALVQRYLDAYPDGEPVDLRLT